MYRISYKFDGEDDKVTTAFMLSCLRIKPVKYF